MRHRARTSVKYNPRHRGAYPFSEARLITAAAAIYAWANIDPLPWEQLPYDTQLEWLAEAECALEQAKQHPVAPCIDSVALSA